MSDLRSQRRRHRLHASISDKNTIFTWPRDHDHLACKHYEILPRFNTRDYRMPKQSPGITAGAS